LCGWSTNSAIATMVKTMSNEKHQGLALSKVEGIATLGSPQDLECLRKTLVAARDLDKMCVTICAGTGCLAGGCKQVTDAFREEIERQGLVDQIDVRTTGCHGFCEQGPLVVIHPKGIFYRQVRAQDVAEVVSETVVQGNVIDRLLYTHPQTGEKIVYEHDVPFYKLQKRLILGDNGFMDPTDIGDYIARDGYSALAKVLYTMQPEDVIDVIKKSGLRGRGGAGFPTGRKWESCRKAEGEPKYVICNADEGDPGAYMNRSTLEGNPHVVLEGMVIGAYAIGSHEGYIYIRHEYPLALENIMLAMEAMRTYGLLGENILGSGFDFDIRIARGGGAFVCGESSALMRSLEGDVGEPGAKYVRSVERGLWDKPSTLNNVETWANVPHIINRGLEWYTNIGTEGSKGTKIFSLVGKVNNTGLVEVPMGTTLREIIFDIGGGIPGGKKFKAVQTGGPSGGCIPESMLDMPVDFDELTKVGSMMGSGGMIVMDEHTCMVDIARYFLNFLREESCGKCTPCREGIARSLEVLNRICDGEGREGDIALLEELGELLAGFSLCALGRTAANPVMSTLRYFRDEYEAHIRDHRCPAGACKALITYRIDPEKCTGCAACARQCPQEAISGEKKQAHVINQDLCIRCGVCLDTCKFGAVLVQ
jgi:NADH:ubiquinone oxidoreductase subunit F (NADH-binding)/(2Fe-2S) ferredoxin/NAD-dependent dihydropyrimidine dehydrogenase PreA subunit